MLVRTWNLFHGNTVPRGRRAYLETMLRLATEDRPDVLLLQEVPPWALGRLGGWTGMAAVGVVAQKPSLGPIPATAEIGRAVTALNPGLLRSAFAGQANAILLGPALRVLDRASIVLNPPRFRSAQARWLALAAHGRLAWAAERRVCQAVRVRLADGRTALVTNLHATSYPPDERLADAELLRAAFFARALAEPNEPVVFGGDLNVTADRSWTLSDLTGSQWGFSAAGRGIDQVLVRGLPAGGPVRWPLERRRVDGLVLSDHAPIEVMVG